MKSPFVFPDLEYYSTISRTLNEGYVDGADNLFFVLLDLERSIQSLGTLGIDPLPVIAKQYSTFEWQAYTVIDGDDRYEHILRTTAAISKADYFWFTRSQRVLVTCSPKVRNREPYQIAGNVEEAVGSFEDLAAVCEKLSGSTPNRWTKMEIKTTGKLAQYLLEVHSNGVTARILPSPFVEFS